MEWIFALLIIGFLGIWIFLMLWSKTNPIMESHKVTGGIVNHNDNFTDFVFKMEGTEASIQEALSTSSSYKDIRIQYFSDTLSFQQNMKLDYKVKIAVHDGYCIIRLKQTPLVTPPTQKCFIPYQINSFMIKKLHAIPISYKPDRDND